MSNNIKKFVSSSLFGIPFVGVLVVLGIANRPQPVLSNQTTYVDPSTLSSVDSHLPVHTWIHQNESSSSEFNREKVARLQRVLTKSVTIPRHTTQLKQVEIASTTTSNVVPTQTPRRNSKIAPKGRHFPQQDGVYLYGQAPKTGQLGQGYIVFEKRQSQVIGALYMPSSEFSCFNGTLQSSGELAMTVTGYPGDKSPTQVATSSTLPQISDDESSTYAHSVTLQEYYSLSNISANDRRLLQVCKANQ